MYSTLRRTLTRHALLRLDAAGMDLVPEQLYNYSDLGQRLDFAGPIIVLLAYRAVFFER